MNKLTNKTRQCIGEDTLFTKETLNSYTGSSTNWLCDLWSYQFSPDHSFIICEIRINIHTILVIKLLSLSLEPTILYCAKYVSSLPSGGGSPGGRHHDKRWKKRHSASYFVLIPFSVTQQHVFNPGWSSLFTQQQLTAVFPILSETALHSLSEIPAIAGQRFLLKGLDPSSVEPILQAAQL